MIKKEFFENYEIHKNTAFIDIETSGLSTVNDEILIISIAKFFNEKKVRIIQIISENDEKNLLTEFITNIIGIYEIYSFNGYEFEEKFIKQKLQKYNLQYDFSTINFISLKNILKNYGNFWNIYNFSRQETENHFDIKREKYYDMKFLVKDIKKNNLNYNNELINHNIDEINTLLELYSKIYKIQFSNKVYINNTYFYLYNFEVSSDIIKLYFKSEKNYKNIKFFMDNGENIEIFLNNIKLEIFIKTIYQKDKKILLYEKETEYIPIFIKNEIIYKNIYYILSEHIKNIL